MAKRHPRRIRRFLLGLTLVVWSSVIGFCSAEVATRMLGLAPEIRVISLGRYRLSSNPKLIYEPIPDFRPPPRDREINFIDYWEGNRLGYRDREHPVSKPEGVFRIAVVGDSLAAGVGIERLDEIFTASVERLLNARGRRVEVLNFSVSGYKTQQEVEMLRTRALEYNPDLVLVAYCLNDRSPLHGAHLHALLNRQKRLGVFNELEIAPILIRSHFYRALQFHVWRRFVAPTDPRDDRDHVPSAFADLAQLQRDHGFAVLIVIFPLLLDYEAYAAAGEHEFVRQLAKKHGFQVLDLLATFDACSGGRGQTLRLYPRDPFHFDARAHSCAAEAIARFIERAR